MIKDGSRSNCSASSAASPSSADCRFRSRRRRTAPAYDIQGKGIADPSATIQAFRTLVMLARRQSAGTVAHAVYSLELGRPSIDGRLTLERGARADVSEPPLGANCRREHLQQYLA